MVPINTDVADSSALQHTPNSRILMTPTVLLLPDAVMELISSWLTFCDMTSHFLKVCRAWYRLALKNNVWQSIVYNKWSVSTGNSERISSASSLPPSILSLRNTNGANKGVDSKTDWRSRYYELMRISRNRKAGRCSTSFLIGHSARITSVTCDANILVR